jgi:hypothetical protein
LESAVSSRSAGLAERFFRIVRFWIEHPVPAWRIAVMHEREGHDEERTNISFSIRHKLLRFGQREEKIKESPKADVQQLKT